MPNKLFAYKRRCASAHSRGCAQLYSWIGYGISRQPLAILLFFFVIAVFTGGLCYFVDIHTDLHEGMTNPDSRTSQEMRVFNEDGNGVMAMANRFESSSMLYVFAKDDANLLDPDTLSAVVKEYRHIFDSVSSVQKPLLASYPELKMADILTAISQYLHSGLPFTYPFLKLPGVPSRLLVADLFLNVTYATEENGVGVLNGVKGMRIPFPTMVGSSKWQIDVYEYTTNEHTHPQFRLVQRDPYLINLETRKSGDAFKPYFGVGVALLLVLVLSSVCLSAYYYHQLHWTKLLVAIAIPINPMIACLSGFGVLVLMQVDFSPLLFLVPFLILAVGSDGGFLMLHSWHNNEMQDWRKRLQTVIAEVGPAITITSGTNVLAFVVGAQTTDSQYFKIFCYATSMCMFMDFMYQFFIFAPTLGLLGSCQKPIDRKDKEISKRLWGFPTKMLNFFSRLIAQSWIWRGAVLVGLLVYLALSIWGLSTLEVDISHLRQLFTGEPKLILAEDMIDDMNKQYFPLPFIVTEPVPNFAACPSMDDDKSASCAATFRRFVRELEAAHSSFGADTTLFWLDEYDSYRRKRTNNKVTLNGDYLQLFPEFMNVPEFRGLYGRMVRWKIESGNVRITAFAFTCFFRDLADYVVRARVMKEWHHVIDTWRENVGYNVSAFEAYSAYYESLLDNVDNMLISIAITAAAMLLICLLFIPSLLTLVTAMMAVCSIAIGICGWLSWWDAKLDQIVTINILMSVGFSVDYTAHVTHHYFSTAHAHVSTTVQGGDKKDERESDADEPATGLERVTSTLAAVTFPMCQAGLSTVLCVAPSAIVSHFARTFNKSILLVVIIGLLHGLLLMPTVLACIDDVRSRLHTGLQPPKGQPTTEDDHKEDPPVVAAVLPPAIKKKKKKDHPPKVVVHTAEVHRNDSVTQAEDRTQVDSVPSLDNTPDDENTPLQLSLTQID